MMLAAMLRERTLLFSINQYREKLDGMKPD